MKYTRRTLIKLHRELWNWCGETGKMKSEWPRWKSNGGDIEFVNSLCFACASHDYGFSECLGNCLFVWGGLDCGDGRSEFYKWCHAETVAKKKFWARKIANLKVRRKK